MHIFKDSTAFTLDRAGLIKALKGGGFAATGAFLTYVVAHVGDLQLGVYTPIVTALLTWGAHAIAAWALPNPEATPTIIHIPQESQ